MSEVDRHRAFGAGHEGLADAMAGAVAPLVIGVAGNLDQALAAVAEGADVIDLDLDSVAGPPAVLLARVLADVSVPVVVTTTRASVLGGALEMGASGGRDPSGFADEEYLPVAAAWDATVAVVAHAAAQARALATKAATAGVPAPRIRVEVPSREVSACSLLGWPITSRHEELDTAALVAEVAVATSLGVSSVRTSNVRAARRTRDVIAGVMNARREVES